MVVQATFKPSDCVLVRVVKGHRNGGSSNLYKSKSEGFLVVKGHRNGGSSNLNPMNFRTYSFVVKGHRNGGSSNDVNAQAARSTSFTMAARGIILS